MPPNKPIKGNKPNNIEAIKPSGLSKAALSLFSSLRLAAILVSPPGQEHTAGPTAIANCDNLPVQLAQWTTNCYIDIYQIPGHENDICFIEDESLCHDCHVDCYGNCYNNWSEDCHNDCHSDCVACFACDEGDGGEEECDPEFGECPPDEGGE